MDGSLLKTPDGGNTWVVKDVPVDSDLQDIFFTDINTGYMIASGYWDTHYILKTTDGGENWNIVYELGNVYHHYRLVSIYFADESNGIVVGDPGLILSTSDGGYSWKKESVITDNSLQGVYMKSNQDAMVVGYNSTILGKGSMQNLPDNSQKDENLLVCFPNPGGECIIASFSAKDIGQVVIRIQDVCGKVLMNKSVSINQPGKQNIRLDCSEIPSGMHFLSIKTQSRLYTSKVLFIH